MVRLSLLFCCRRAERCVQKSDAASSGLLLHRRYVLMLQAGRRYVISLAFHMPPSLQHSRVCRRAYFVYAAAYGSFPYDTRHTVSLRAVAVRAVRQPFVRRKDEKSPMFVI